MRGAGVDIVSTELAGRLGLAELADWGRFSAADPGAFRWGWRVVHIDGIEIVEWSTTSVTGVSAVGTTAHAVVLVAVIEGLLRYRIGSIEGTAPSGSVLLFTSADRIEFTVPQPLRCLRVAVPAAVLPQHIESALTSSAGSVLSTRLTETLTALAEVVLDPLLGGSRCPAAQAIRAVLVATLEEVAPSSPLVDQRSRIIAFIEAHLPDPSLSPRTIADEFQISLRWTHHLFSKDGETLTRFIRDRRLDLVAAQLRSDHRFPRLGTLAEHAGFSSRDQLTRAFKARFHTTIAEYAAEAAGPGHPRR